MADAKKASGWRRCCAGSDSLESSCGPYHRGGITAVPWAPTCRVSGGTEPRSPKPTTSSSSMP